MGKAILEFKLPEEQDEFTLAKNGGKYFCILCEVFRIIREHDKYEKKLECCWEELVDAMNEFEMDEVS